MSDTDVRPASSTGRPGSRFALPEEREAPIVLLDRPRHLGNVGAAIRVAAADEAAAVIVTGAADPWHPQAVRGAAGPQIALPVGRVEEVPSDDVLDRADARAALPMRPGVSSLNLTTAVAATLYSLRAET